MFLRSTRRFKDGKEHRYWSVVENHRVAGGRVAQRQVLYLGEINESQRQSWCKTLETFEEKGSSPRQLALFPSDREAPELNCEVVKVRMDQLSLHNPRQWGTCWLSLLLWDQLRFDEFWSGRLPPSRQGTKWLNVLKTLACYHLINPGSEWRLHRHWFERSAMADLLGEDISLVQIDKLYRCLDKLLPHKQEMFSFLRTRWKEMFNVGFDVLLYDLTSTYFECDQPKTGKRRYGYSRDKRPDCVQVVIALIVTPDGLPIAYEVLPGNTSDKTTLKDFINRIERQYGKANRTWVMDRGIPTEEVLSEMKNSSYPIYYLVGTPKGRLTKMEKKFLELPWENVRESVDVKLLNHEGELYVLARSAQRVNKERSMRKRRLKKLWARLHDLQSQKITRDDLLIKLGAAKKEAGRSYGLVNISLPEKNEEVSSSTFTFSLNKKKLRMTRLREGRYLLRSNLTGETPEVLWQQYIQLTEVEQAFKELKNDLNIRPIYHQKENRIEAHIFIAFIAYCLQVTLKQRLRSHAPGLTPRAVLEKLSGIQMVDVHLPTTDGRKIILSRYTQPDKDKQLLLQKLNLYLPPQPPPKVSNSGKQLEAV